ncbi:MAG: LegC family aminotransferase [Cyclobacteriaceae bacterium]|nr:LegC family aminotransferase [Cyclobacteriaceae bacterium]
MNHTDIVNFIKIQFPDKDFIPLHEPKFIGNERKYVIDALDSTFVSSVGPYVNQFEEMMTQITGSKYAVATVNGTAALHLSLLVAGVNRNDLVISQALTFVATCNAINYVGAEPVFVDVDLDTMGISPKALETWLERNTLQTFGSEKKAAFHKVTGQRIAAVVPMHTFGHPCQIDLIKEICDRHNIPLIEDAAESIGSYFKKRHTGTFGLIGSFSFNGNKTLTCGGGGAIITDDAQIARLAKHLSTQAKQAHPWEFSHDFIGYNYRLPNINAALACAQLEQLDKFLLDKRDLASKYKFLFQECSSIKFKQEPIESISNYWLNTIELADLEERNEFLRYTNSNGVMTRPAWILMNKLPMFLKAQHDELTNSIFLADRLVNIPSSVRL